VTSYLASSPTRRRTPRAGKIRLRPISSDWVDIENWKATGVALLPPDRGREGIVAAMTVGENLSLSVLERLSSIMRLHHRRERRFCHTWIRKLDVQTSGVDVAVQNLSGGNQQKVLFGRTLAREPQVLLCAKPTAGVDIGARHAIYDLVADQVAQGLSVIVTSSDVGRPPRPVHPDPGACTTASWRAS
jgi:ABC-type sugar transport system ATPase subunit